MFHCIWSSRIAFFKGKKKLHQEFFLVDLMIYCCLWIVGCYCLSNSFHPFRIENLYLLTFFFNKFVYVLLHLVIYTQLNL
uniref:Uncharacterized protein n=1 Tax=Manihot esculenta TaxID=3983 RepID=A0A251KS32_MANES